MKKKSAKLAVVPELIKLDIGSGKNKKEGFLGVDKTKMVGVDQVVDVVKKVKVIRQEPGVSSGLPVVSMIEEEVFAPWPWKDDSVEEVHCSHFLEHLTANERIHFFNELERVLRPGGKATIVTPHWCSNRAYGDPTHQWPPVSEMMYHYLDKKWRTEQAPHTDIEFNPHGYKCDFLFSYAYGLHQHIIPRNPEYQSHALNFWKEAAQDIHATVTKKG